jgi:hypothetical protein
LVNEIIDFENGELSQKNTLKLFSKLIKSGDVWNLQGFYGRTATDFIESRLIDDKGKINWDRLDELENEC